MRAAAPRASRGFTYLMVLFWIVVVGVALGAIGQTWHTMAVRDKERELLFIGDEFRRAIVAYSQANPRVADGYPKTLEELLLDPHQPTVRRYLRRIYPDPFSGEATWGLVRTPSGGILGVYSLAEGKPIKVGGFPAQYAQFADAAKYTDWKFAVALPSVPGVQNVSNAALLPNPAPTAPSPGSSASIVAAASSDPGPDDPEPSCEVRSMWDQESCQNEVRKWGKAEPCFDSAHVRLQACLGGRRLPNLVLRYQ